MVIFPITCFGHPLQLNYYSPMLRTTKAIAVTAAAMSMFLPLAVQAKDVDVFNENIAGVEWQTKIKNVEKGPGATLILRKNGDNQCKENAMAYAKWQACANAKVGVTYATKAVNAILKAIPGL